MEESTSQECYLERKCEEELKRDHHTYFQRSKVGRIVIMCRCKDKRMYIYIYKDRQIDKIIVALIVIKPK